MQIAWVSQEWRIAIMAKCQQCGKGPQFGNNRPWSKKATRRHWDVNIQKVTIMEEGKPVSKRLCTACLKTATKS
jgi:large subunit ribosomal protein L28